MSAGTPPPASQLSQYEAKADELGPLKLGDVHYAVPITWMNHWKLYVGMEGVHDTGHVGRLEAPGPVDASSLADPDRPLALRRGLVS